MDEKEEGEISLEDVSSSEDLSINNHRKKKSRSRKIKLKNNMNDKRDAAWGKENRKFSNGFIGTEHRTLLNQEDSKNGLTPISSGEEIEYVSVPGSSQQIEIKTGQKKRRKKKKKKKAGPRMLTMDDLESDVVSDFRPDDKSFISTQPMTYASAPIIYNEVRETITITTTNHQSRSQKSTRQHYSSPVRSHRSPPENPRSPSSRRRSPRKFLPPGKPSTSSSVPTKHCSHKTLYQNKRHDEAYTSSLLKKVKEYDTTAVIPARQNRYKESSLKEKLNNMTKLHSDFKGGDNNNSKDNNNESIKIENLDDEDLDTLRRLALDTQQSRQDEDEQQQNSNNNNDNNSTNSDNTQTVLFNDSNHNVEELQLRAQALKTAVMNKCKNKGLFIKKRDKVIKDEATYNDSLLNDVIENIEENSAYSPGAFSVHYNKGSDVADMELDSDVEREKINSQAYSPYSPTDEVGDTFGDSYLTTDLLEDNKNQEMLDLEAPYSPSDIPASKLTSPKSNQYNYPISDSDKSYLPNTSNFKDYNVVPTLSVHMPLNNVELNNISTLYGSLNVSSLNLSPLEQLNNSMLGNKNLSNNNKVLEPTEQVKFNETVVNSSARRAAKKDALYDEVLRDLEEDYGPIIRENEINNTVNVTSKLVPAPILRINKHLQKTLPLKQVDNPVKVFKSAEMKPVDINNQFVKTNTTFKPIKIPQPVKKSLASTSAEAFDSSIDESTTNCSNITPDDSSNNVTEKESVTTSDQVKRKPGRPKTPSKKITTTTVATNKNSKVTCNKAKTLTDKNINKKEQKTDRLNDETGKSESIKELSIITNKLDNNCKIDQILKQKKDSLLGKVSKIKNTKKPESLASTSETNDNKRRSSFEEEELRALALASLSKRLKPSGSSNKDSNSKESATNNVRFVKNNAQKPAMSKTITPSDGIPSTSSGITSNNNKKRPISADSQGPPKKIIKKSIKPTERVPKAIQSIIPQKFVQNKKKVPTLVPQSNPVVNNNNNSNINTVNKTNDPIDSLTSKITSTKKIQRMVINLGEDSDTDSEFEQLASVSRSNFKIPATRSNNPLTVPDTDFEKRLEDLLRSQREKTESSASKSSATTNSSDFSKTPQAMRHMPPDKLEEYRRLKQRAAELEKSITNDKRKRNPDKPNSAVKPTEAIPNPTKSLPKKIIKPGVEKTSSFVNAASTSTSVSAKTLSADKSISFSINNDISNTNSNSELSSKREENRLKVLANCSQEILKIIPKTNRKINLIRKANDNSNDERTDETIAQNVNVNVKSSDEIIEAIGTTASSDSFEYMHDSVIESFIIEEEKVDPNIIASISESHVVKNNSNVINWPRVSADDLSGNNKFDKLVIQISNTRDIDVLPRRQVNVIKKDQDKKSEPVKPQEKVAGPTLRILTADQVNMKGKVAAPTLRILTADQLNMRTDQSVTIETTTTMTTATVTGITETVTSSQERENDNVMLNYNKKILHTCDNNNLINEMTIEEEEENKFDASIVVISESLNSDNRTNISELSIDNSSQVSKNDTVNNTVNTATGTSSESTESPSERINAEIKIVIDDYKLLSSEEQQSKLTTMESKFTEKKQMELDAYNILTENLQELETERQIQLDLSTQVKRLRAELKLAEERLKVQQEKLTGISGKIMTNKNFVNDRRNECNNHARICTEMGLIVVGKDYKIPPVGNQLSREAMKEVANRIKRLRKKAGSVDIGNNSDQQSNDDQSSVSSKDTCNTDDLYNLKINNQLNEQLGEVKIENSTEPLQVNLLSNEKDSTNVTNTVTSVDGQSGNDKTIVIKTENVENDRTETTSGTSNSRPEKEINNSNNNKKNNPEGIETEVAVKQEIIDIELESLPVDSEFTISYPNLESELNQIEMECIAKNEQDDLNELESRLTPIDPTLPEESYPMTEPMQQDDNINSIEPKTENDNDNNLTLPVFTNAPPVNDISLLIRPTVQTSQLSSSSGGNSSVDITDSLSKILGDNLSTRRKECEKKIKISQPVKSYESILPALNPTRNLDPNAVLCPFELKGTCKDDACTYAHLNHRSTT